MNVSSFSRSSSDSIAALQTQEISRSFSMIGWLPPTSRLHGHRAKVWQELRLKYEARSIARMPERFECSATKINESLRPPRRHHDD